MNIMGTPLSEIGFETIWMLLSLAVAGIGLIGWWLVQTFVGAKAIVQRKDGEPEFSAVEEQVLPDYAANRQFKRSVINKTSKTPLGAAFFKLFVVGLVAHIAFWIYAAKFMNAQ